jgi:anti-anti-sigma factor
MVGTTGFELRTARAGELLVLSGRLDVRVTPEVRLALAAAVDDGVGELVLDVSGLDAVDATGLGVLVGAHRRAGRVGRSVVLQDVPPALARGLAVTRLHRVLRTRRTAVCA